MVQVDKLSTDTIVVFAVIAAFAYSDAAKAQQRPQATPSVDYKAYYACMNREAAAGVKRAVDRGTKFWDVNTKQIGDETLELCTSRFSNGVVVQQRDRETAEWTAKDALNVQMRVDTEKRQAALQEKAAADAARDAPMLNAAQHRYGDCLFKSAETIALVSSETADLVREAAFAACREERKALVEMHRPYRDNYEHVLDVADKQLAGPVLLHIIKARVARSSIGRDSDTDVSRQTPPMREPL